MSGFAHQPVMAGEVLAALRPQSGGRFVDGTVGGGGHAGLILAASAPDGWLHGFDRDDAALAAAAERLAGFAGRFELRRANYAELADWVPAESCDGVLLDLGVSSPQLDVAERGFSFLRDGPLDMRMDRRQGRTAADWVNEAPPEELARIFRDFGDQPGAWGLAKVLVRERMRRRFETTGQLAEFIARWDPRKGRRTHPATQVFLALRMAVNDELGALRQGLAAAVRVLRRGGRLAVITFHSAEDRVVKEFGREAARDYTFDGSVDVPELRRPRVPVLAWLSRKAIPPTAAECAENPRSRSAQLRVLEKL